MIKVIMRMDVYLSINLIDDDRTTSIRVMSSTSRAGSPSRQ